MNELISLLRHPITASRCTRTAPGNAGEAEYARQHRPDESRRYQLRAALGPRFVQVSAALAEDGIVILSSYFGTEQLKPLREFLAAVFSQKLYDPVLGQVSFNGAVDRPGIPCPSALESVALDPLLLCLATDAFGLQVTVANWRAYRLEPAAPQLYRAWDWHTDQKRNELKAMLLLTDVTQSDQAMHYIKGSHRHWWKLETQQDSKFTFEEAMAFGSAGTVTECTGPAGTLILFNTNGIHRGTRTMGRVREIVSVNFVPDLPGSPVFQYFWCDTEDGGAETRAEPMPTASASRPRTSTAITDLLLDSARRHLDRSVWDRQAHDAGSQRLAQLRKEYASTPRAEDLKARYMGTDLGTFLAHNFWADLRADLDLPIRMGAGDVERDVELVRFRDSLNTDVQQCFQACCRALDSTLPGPVVADAYSHQLQLLLGRLSSAAHTESESWRAVVAFAKDIVDAMGYVDTPQRLRSYALYLSLISLVLDVHYSTSPAVAATQESFDLIAAYARFVAADDLTAGKPC